MARIAPVIATSACWNAMVRVWRTTRALKAVKLYLVSDFERNAYNLNYRRSIALFDEMADWSLASLQHKLIKIGA